MIMRDSKLNVSCAMIANDLFKMVCLCFQLIPGSREQASPPATAEDVLGESSFHCCEGIALQDTNKNSHKYTSVLLCEDHSFLPVVKPNVLMAYLVRTCWSMLMAPTRSWLRLGKLRKAGCFFFASVR